MNYKLDDPKLIEFLSKLVTRQLNSIFMFEDKVREDYVSIALERTGNCLSHSNDKFFRDMSEMYFSPFHSGQYAIFLWYLSNTVWKHGKDSELATIIYYLNKSLNTVDWYFEIEMPEVFGTEHPLGSILGRAQYGSHLFLYQGTTIGGMRKNNQLVYPKLGDYVTLHANASVLGDSLIGNYVVIGAGSMVKGETIPDCSVVFGISPNLTIIEKSADEIQEYFKDKWKS